MKVQTFIKSLGKFYVSNGSRALWGNGSDAIGGKFQSQKAQIITNKLSKTPFSLLPSGIFKHDILIQIASTPIMEK
jgi:hypothetical protein